MLNVRSEANRVFDRTVFARQSWSDFYQSDAWFFLHALRFKKLTLLPCPRGTFATFFNSIGYLLRPQRAFETLLAERRFRLDRDSIPAALRRVTKKNRQCFASYHAR